MSSYPSRGHRRSIRLPGYDYTQPGAYFVTFCTYQGEALFGEVINGVMVLNAYGEIAQREWLASAAIRREIALDAFVIMPTHGHAIVWILSDDAPDADAHGRTPSAPTALQRAPKSLGALMAGYKSAVTRQINALRNTPDMPVWQRNYYEHIIRTEHALNAIRQYILDNPARWHLDRYNPQASAPDPLAAELWRLLKEDIP
ncbi:MAG: transposase [Anaerolineae bacterium]|nr:transposase [Anaerolineae bacterium]